ncbi:MAG: Npt1/Npt2 family nucleotide transporter [Rhabdochlamydiaceae bacterium]|jgi:AAA family ATP:ADP antiporter
MSTKPFGTLRALLWPVYREEYPKFIPMFLISFLICFNYYLLRIAKDAVLITAPESGAEAIPFIKVWGILPTAVVMMFIFTRFSNWLNRRTIFYAMMWLFIGYFALFTFVLYPNREMLHPNGFADQLQSILPQGLKGFIALIRNWTYSTFYIMSEMWSTMIMTILFWGFANDVTSVKDAKRFYGLFGVGTNLAGVLAGALASCLSMNKFNPSLLFGATAWDQYLFYLGLMVISAGLLCMGLYWLMNRAGKGYTEATLQAHRDAPVKMGMRKSFQSILKTPYLGLIAILVIAYNIVMNLAEVVWKDQVKQLYPSAAEFNKYMGDINFWIALMAAVISFFISGNLIRILGWTKSALIAPILTLIAGAFFFAVLLLPKESILGICISFGTTPIALAVLFGSIQNCIVRGTKYSLVDATKEMAFIPLSQSERLKGKAAIDGIGSRLGKSGGSVMIQFLIITFGTIAGTVPIVAGLLCLAIGGWIVSVRSLGKQFNSLTTEPEKDEKGTEVPLETT